jgi:hypothetical protein
VILSVYLMGTVLSSLAGAQQLVTSDSYGSKSFQAAFADCVVELKAEEARQFVIGRHSPPRPSRCLRGAWAQASFAEPTYRYMLARSLIRNDYSAGVPDDIAVLGKVAFAPTSPPEKKDADAPRRLVLADCVVRRAPIKAFALAQAEAGEGSAEAPMATLMSTIATCSNTAVVRYPRGFQLQEAIVTRLYQLAYAARKPRNA